MSSTAASDTPAAATPRRRRLTAPTDNAPKSRGVVLAVILICQLMVVLDGTVVNIALPSIKTSLGFSSESLSWVLNAYTLAFGGMLLLGARAGDLLGRRPVFLFGIVLFTLGSLAGGLAQSSGELLAARAAQGVGGAFASPTALALIMVMWPDAKERMRPIGAYTAVSVGGSAVGLVLGGMITQWADWRWVFFVNVPVGVVLVALALPTLPKAVRRRGRFDLVGALSSVAGITALVYGFVHAASNGWGNAQTVGSFAIGAALLALFVVTETRAAEPITPLRLFRNRNRVGAYTCRLLLLASMMGMFFFLTQYLQNVLHYSALRTGFAFVPMTLGTFLSAQLCVRYLQQRVSLKSIMVSGTVLSTVGIFMLTFINPDTSYVYLVISVVIFGFGNGLAFTSMTSYAIDDVLPEDAGAASGLVNVMQQVGGALGLAVLVTIFGTASSHAAQHPAAGASPAEIATQTFIHGAKAAFIASTVVMIAAIIATVVLIRGEKSDRVEQPEADLELDQLFENV